MLDIQLLPATAAGDQALVAQLTDLVNEVYRVAEAGIYSGSTTRTTPAEIAGLIGAGEIAVARLDGELVGAVRVQLLADGVGEFGMLVSSPRHRALGIGRELVRFSEEWCAKQGATTVQLELLVPHGEPHPTKVFLHDWYTRIGYQRVRVENFADSYPELAATLARPCDFVIYHKPLD